MSPSSAKNPLEEAHDPGGDYVTHIDSQGIQRRKYKTYCIECGIERLVTKTRLNKQKRCRACANKLPPTEEQRKRISETLRNKYATDADFKRRVAAAQNVSSGDKHWNWKGGVTPLNQRTRTSGEVNAWRLAVFHRDHYKCRICEETKDIQAHHINSWAAFPEDRFVLENGLTLCAPCHKQYHDYEREVSKNGTKTLVS